jgi:DNA (cytosine-5)-methyltransferase 1
MKQSSKPLILSLFCGCGGLDLGFEQAGFATALAYDLRAEAVASWKKNRGSNSKAFVKDITKLRLADLDQDHGEKFFPVGVIGGPPCQSFSRANAHKSENDPRSGLVNRFITLALRLHRCRGPLDFIVLENVPELLDANSGSLIRKEVSRLVEAGFHPTTDILDAVNFGVPQFRKRMFLIAVRKSFRLKFKWPPQSENSPTKTISDVLLDLPSPAYFSRELDRDSIPSHPNHWCMTPKSPRFFDGSLKEGYSSGRSFKTLSWLEPSLTVSYGNREVHVHPTGRRRLSVFESMRLQGFPDNYVLEGTLSSQITQVSEAVPPPLGYAVARLLRQLYQSSGPYSAANASSCAKTAGA